MLFIKAILAGVGVGVGLGLTNILGTYIMQALKLRAVTKMINNLHAKNTKLKNPCAKCKSQEREAGALVCQNCK